MRARLNAMGTRYVTQSRNSICNGFVALGPKPTSSHPWQCCGAARQSRHSLRLQDLMVGVLTVRGQTGLMQMQPLLTQHLLAAAARDIWQRSICHQSSRSNRSSARDLKLTIRCTVHSSVGKIKLVSVQEYRGTKGHHDTPK